MSGIPIGFKVNKILFNLSIAPFDQTGRHPSEKVLVWVLLV